MLDLGGLAPVSPGLQPEDARGDVALLGLGEQRAADHRISPGEPELELLGVVLLQGVERQPDQLGDLLVQRSGGGMVLDQPAAVAGGLMGRVLHPPRGWFFHGR